MVGTTQFFRGIQKTLHNSRLKLLDPDQTGRTSDLKRSSSSTRHRVCHRSSTMTAGPSRSSAGVNMVTYLTRSSMVGWTARPFPEAVSGVSQRSAGWRPPSCAVQSPGLPPLFLRWPVRGPARTQRSRGAAVASGTPKAHAGGESKYSSSAESPARHER